MFAIGCPDIKAYLTVNANQSLNDNYIQHSLDSMRKTLDDVAAMRAKYPITNRTHSQNYRSSMISFIKFLASTFSPLMDNDAFEIENTRRPSYISDKIVVYSNWSTKTDRIKFFRTSRNAKATYNRMVSSYKAAVEILDALQPMARYFESVIEYEKNMVLNDWSNYHSSYHWPAYDLMFKGSLNIYDRNHFINNALPKSKLKSLHDDLLKYENDPLNSNLFAYKLKMDPNYQLTPENYVTINRHIKSTKENIDRELMYMYKNYSCLKFCMDNWQKVFPNAKFEIAEFKLTGPY